MSAVRYTTSELQARQMKLENASCTSMKCKTSRLTAQLPIKSRMPHGTPSSQATFDDLLSDYPLMSLPLLLCLPSISDRSYKQIESHVARQDYFPATLVLDRVPTAILLPRGSYYTSGVRHNWGNASQDIEEWIQRISVILHRNLYIYREPRYRAKTPLKSPLSLSLSTIYLASSSSSFALLCRSPSTDAGNHRTLTFSNSPKTTKTIHPS
jgi:hypothetical protein